MGKVSLLSKTFATEAENAFQYPWLLSRWDFFSTYLQDKYISKCEGWWEDTYFEKYSLWCLRPYKGLKRPWFSLCKYLFNSCVNTLNKVSSWVTLRVSENEYCGALSLPLVVIPPLTRLNDANRSLKLLGRHYSPGLVHVLYRALLTWFSSNASLECINSCGKASGDFPPVGTKGELFGESREKRFPKYHHYFQWNMSWKTTILILRPG